MEKEPLVTDVEKAANPLNHDDENADHSRRLALSNWRLAQFNRPSPKASTLYRVRPGSGSRGHGEGAAGDGCREG